ncbi:uncharacterized protein LOC106064200 [Biomphalaria glabrata]|uniref:Sex-determining region Y protein n=1 Tax=Biomphalaria glabrata TaxID=6526 RepID=A0A2C9JHC1_BIOGL|nr:uncharacterized protein LOC106064200 [Biomphalaria glabrata]KAI8773673.1 hypothetical protein BgiBS90_024858 [Biomphalaria glabrata]
MDYGNDADPMISSVVIFQDYHSMAASQQASSFGMLDFDSYSRPTMLDEPPNNIDMNLDSPASIETYHSDMELGFQDNQSVESPAEHDTSDSPITSVASTPQKCSSFDDDMFEQDRRLVNQRFAPHDVFPVDNSWTLEQKIDRLLELSPCDKYTREELLNIDSVENPEQKVDMLINLVARIRVNFRWNYVKPEELCKGYTVVTNCKKEKKKDSEGQTTPKRPMNAFMIWSMKCRTLISHISPQLHNAIISTKLGAAWRKFDEEEKGYYEREKEILTNFHRYEFPDYKYKPRKKPKKTEEKPSPVPKPKSNKRKKVEPVQPPPLRGINIVDARQSLDPHLKERLQVKMQVKIDPDLKKEIGKRVTGIDLTDLSSYNHGELASPPFAKLQRLSTDSSSAVHLIIDNKPSSVFDTPENSPHTPITPVTPTENVMCFTRGDSCFNFEENKTSIDLCYHMENNNNVIHSMLAESIKADQHQVRWDLSAVKSEPQEYQYFCATVKTEPGTHPCPTATLDMDEMPQLPVLSSDILDEVLPRGDAVSIRETMSFNNDDLLSDLMNIVVNGGDYLPDLASCVPEGPATV